MKELTLTSQQIAFLADYLLEHNDINIEAACETLGFCTSSTPVSHKTLYELDNFVFQCEECNNWYELCDLDTLDQWNNICVNCSDKLHTEEITAQKTTPKLKWETCSITPEQTYARASFNYNSFYVGYPCKNNKRYNAHIGILNDVYKANIGKFTSLLNAQLAIESIVRQTLEKALGTINGEEINQDDTKLHIEFITNYLDF